MQGPEDGAMRISGWLSLFLVAYSLPSQVLRNWEQGQCFYDFPTISIAIVATVLRMPYLYRKKEWRLLGPDTLALGFWFIFLAQYIFYKWLST